MELSLVGGNDSITIRVSGELKAGTGHDLRHMVLEAADRSPVRISLDLAQTSFVDTTAIGLLVSLRAQLTSRGIRFELLEVSERLRAVLRAMRLLDLFGVEDTPRSV